MANDTISAHAITTAEDEVSTTEAIRLYGTRRANTRARWENVACQWEQGKTLAEIGKWIGKSESTVRQLLKRAHAERRKLGQPWPTDRRGRRLCDIPYPMPPGGDVTVYSHTRAFELTKAGRFFCPVCRRAFWVGKTLIEVLT